MNEKSPTAKDRMAHRQCLSILRFCTPKLRASRDYAKSPVARVARVDEARHRRLYSRGPILTRGAEGTPRISARR